MRSQRRHLPAVGITVLLVFAMHAVQADPLAAPAVGGPPKVDSDPLEALRLAALLGGQDLGLVEATAAAATPRATDLSAAYHGAAAALAVSGSPPAELVALQGSTLEAPLIDLLDALRDAALAVRAAQAAVPAGQLETLHQAYREARLAGTAPDADLAAPHTLPRERLIAAALRLTEAGLAAAPALRTGATAWSGTACLADLQGILALCGPGDDRLEGDFALVVDLGGDDEHRTNAGSSGIGVLWPGTNGLPAAMSLDLDGNDHYVGDSQVQGSASSSAGILLDLGGDDRYVSETRFFNFVQGAGNLGGVGLLYDAAGHDTYHTLPGRDAGQTAWDAQGFGILGGIGILHDAGGNDHYVGGAMAQGVGDFDAVGSLLDGGGDDVYEAVRRGQGFADGTGQGMLLDLDGHDVYHLSEQQGQGAGIGGHGTLADLRGNDRYQAGGAAQGWAESGAAWKPVNDLLVLLGRQAPASGALLDGAGTDTYSGPGCDGCAWRQDAGSGLDV